LTRSVAGTTQTRLIPAEQAELVRRQIEVGRQFRDAEELYWQACERLADEQLQGANGAGTKGEKGGSARRSRRRLRTKSKRS
jgi:hypothetical protein